jgi:hypothetical protein
MGAAASCTTARAIPYTIDGHTLSLLTQATHTHHSRRSSEVTFHRLGTRPMKISMQSFEGRLRYLDLSTIQLYDQHRFMPTKSAAVVVNYGNLTHLD